MWTVSYQALYVVGVRAGDAILLRMWRRPGGILYRANDQCEVQIDDADRNTPEFNGHSVNGMRDVPWNGRYTSVFGNAETSIIREPIRMLKIPKNIPLNELVSNQFTTPHRNG